MANAPRARYLRHCLCLRSRRGASRELLDLLYAERFEALTSQALFLQYEDVMGRPEHQSVHGFRDDRLASLIADLADCMTAVEINFRYRPQLRDPNDDLVLEAALNGGADAIVTHNVRDFLPESSQRGMAVFTPGPYHCGEVPPMSHATISIEVPENLMQDALQSAAREGKSLHQWVRSALEERVRLERTAEEFFRRRSAGATGQTLRWALDNGPDRPPDPGDEFEPE